MASPSTLAVSKPIPIDTRKHAQGSFVALFEENRTGNVERAIVGGAFVTADGMEAVAHIRFAVQMQVEADETHFACFVHTNHGVTVVNAGNWRRVCRCFNVEAFASVVNTKSSGCAPLCKLDPFPVRKSLCCHDGGQIHVG